MVWHFNEEREGGYNKILVSGSRNHSGVMTDLLQTDSRQSLLLVLRGHRPAVLRKPVVFLFTRQEPLSNRCVAGPRVAGIRSSRSGQAS